METTTATTDNAGNGNRIDQFKTEVTDLNLKTGNASREDAVDPRRRADGRWHRRRLLHLHLVEEPGQRQLDVGSAIAYTVAWLTLVVAGAALFLRYSLAAFLRMWLLRQLYEGQANTDRLIETIADRG